MMTRSLRRHYGWEVCVPIFSKSTFLGTFAMISSHWAPFLNEKEGRYMEERKPLGDCRLLIQVDLHDGEFISCLRHHLIEEGIDDFALTAPVRPKIDDDQFARLLHRVVKLSGRE